MFAMAAPRPRRGHSPTTRSRRSLDRSGPEALESVGADQIAYYRARAPWYDDAYDCAGDYDRGPELNAHWLADLSTVERALRASPVRGDCVELGAGTGYWTERVVNRVQRLWALDAAPEVLSIAQARLGARASRVEFDVVDLWRWQPRRTWDSAVAFFFLEHVPDELLPGLLASLHDALAPGAPFFVAEGAAYDSEPQIETRSIDGRAYDVVERRRSPGEFETAFASAGFSVESMTVTGGRLVHLVALRD
jgi:demethylmenaquinone methyltransferase/2-methoxy-6-polyprenyl-1,4-benzoquinol methylase